MKTRQGFVSNSSSSSFVIIGRELTPSELNEETFSGRDIQAVGGYLWEGRLVMEVNWEMYQFIQEHKEELDNLDGFDDLTYYEVFYNGFDDDGKINKDDLPEGDLVVIAGEMDHHSPNDLDSLEECLEELND